MKTTLLISLPGTSDYTSYSESDGNDAVDFRFIPFARAEKPIRIKLTEDRGKPDITLMPVKEPEFYFYTREEYVSLINRTIKVISDKNWGKVVISRPYLLRNFREEPLKLFEKLRYTYPGACTYLFQHPDCGVWMGATPETLLRGKKGKLWTMSLAGTREKGREGGFEEKESEEQRLVTQYITEKLQVEKGISDVEVSKKSTLEAGNVVHFVNYISANYTTAFRPDAFLEEFHPTPAVGGFPKEEALGFIHRNEKHQRSFYTGYFGIQESGKFNYFVNLRCMQIFSNAAVLYAGGGITASSDPESEWQETEAKMRTLLNVLTSDY